MEREMERDGERWREMERDGREMERDGYRDGSGKMERERWRESTWDR